MDGDLARWDLEMGFPRCLQVAFVLLAATLLVGCTSGDDSTSYSGTDSGDGGDDFGVPDVDVASWDASQGRLSKCGSSELGVVLELKNNGDGTANYVSGRLWLDGRYESGIDRTTFTVGSIEPGQTSSAKECLDPYKYWSNPSDCQIEWTEGELDEVRWRSHYFDCSRQYSPPTTDDDSNTEDSSSSGDDDSAGGSSSSDDDGGQEGNDESMKERTDTSQALTIVNETLPEPRWGMGTAWTGDATVLAGGQNGSHAADTFDQQFDTVLLHQPNDGIVQRQDATLPQRTRSMASAWTGDNMLLFGGRSRAEGNQDEILRYSPSTDRLERADVTLPGARERASAVWTGTHAYVFGGIGYDEIVRYDPGDDSVQVMDATLPTERWEMDAVWSGDSAYLFGGANRRKFFDDILRYDPAEGELTNVGVSLGEGRSGVSAVWVGDAAYVFGGGLGKSTSDPWKTDEILRFDPKNMTVSRMNATLPSPRHLTEAVWTGQQALVYGGTDEQGLATDNILQYSPSQDHPIETWGES